MKKVKFLLLISFVFLLPEACKKIEHISNIPQIEYLSFQISDTTDILGNRDKCGKLNFSFQDGDGDIGVHDQSPDTNDMNIILYRKINGIMTMVPESTIDPLKISSFRIPYMERTGQNKILKGKIEIFFLYLDYSPADTIQYDFNIEDRAGNISNTATTKEIVVAKNATY
jgi:hypothetical protein